MPTETGQEDDAASIPEGTALVAGRAAPAFAGEVDPSLRAGRNAVPDPGREAFLIAAPPSPPPTPHDASARLSSAPDSRILLRSPALKERFAPLARLMAPYRLRLARALDREAARPQRRRRFALGASALLNIALLAIMFIYGRVVIRAPDRPVDSMSVVFVDLPEPPPFPELRDIEVAPPDPLIAPQPVREPEPEPVPEPEPPVPEPELAPQPPDPAPAPEPLLPNLSAEPQFLPPQRETEAEPLIAEPAPQEPAPAQPQPIEPGPAQQTPVADAGDAADGDQGQDEDDQQEKTASETLAVEERKPPENDDAYDEARFAPRFALPTVDLPEGETSSAPGQSGVLAIFCPDEFKDREKAAECAGRPEIRSGWRPGGSGEDFSRAVDLLKQQRERGDFSAGQLGTEAQRRAEDLKKQGELDDFRKSQGDINNLGLESNDPAAGSRPNIGPASVEPSWARRDDPLVDQKDIDELKKELDAAADAKEQANDD